MQECAETILVVGSPGDQDAPARRERGLGESREAHEISPVRVSELRKNIDTFFSQLQGILDTGNSRIGAFQIDQIEVTAQITGEGKVCLLGSGTSLGVSGGFKFVLKRSD